MGDADDVLSRLNAAAGELRRVLGRALSLRLTPLLESGAPDAAVVAAARDVLAAHAGDLAGLVADGTAAAWLTGAGSVAGLTLAGATAPPALADDWSWRGRRAFAPLVRGAVADLRERHLVTRPEYDALSREAKRRAFTLAGTETERALQSVRDVLAEAVEEGLSWRQARARLRAEALDGLLTENAVRTNVTRAYSAGMDRVLDEPQVDEAYPFEEAVVTDDSRLSDLCDTIRRSGLQGTAIFYRKDPVYLHFKSPRHWQCRCARRPMSVEDAARRGIRAARRWLQTGVPPLGELFVPWPDAELPKGWIPPGEGGGVLRMSLEVCHAC